MRDYARFQLESTYLTLISDLLTTAISEASSRTQLEVTTELLAGQKSQLLVIEAQFKSGAIARPAVLAQQTLIEQTRATVPQLEESLALAQHQLAVYIGQFPSTADLPLIQLDTLKPPHELPLSLPSSLVRQRPDIRASENLTA